MASSATNKSLSALDGLNVKWDRTIIFLLGAAALFLAVLTGILAPLTTSVTWPWPVFLVLVGAGSIAALRYLAVQERRERAGGLASTASVSDGEGSAVRRRDDAAGVFDNEEHAAEESLRRERQERADLDLPADQEFLDDLRFEEDAQGAQYHVPRGEQAPAELPERLTPENFPAQAPATVARDIPTHDELVAAAKKVAEQSSRTSGSTWEPVPVPKPTYARTAVARRETPKALAVPQTPAPRQQSLKDAAKAPEVAPKTAGIDLDDVLKRRRA